MGLSKRNYVDQETVITAQNLNDIQDEIIALSGKPDLSSTATDIKMDGTQSAGSSTKAAKADHVHPTDTSRVPTSRKINNLDLSADRTLTAENIGYDDTLSSHTADSVGEELSTLKGAINQIPNPNLLDNWYFVGGGSQQGGGQFPINQRGQTSYSNVGYKIDRWTAALPNTVTVENDSIKIDSQYFSQKIENWKDLIGKTVTLSVYGKGNFRTYINNIGAGDSISVDINSDEYTVNSVVITIPDVSQTGEQFVLYAINTSYIKAVKLELGSTQTLAHQENGVWVLNEIPNYQDELVKCIGSHADSSDTYANYDFEKVFDSQNKVISTVTLMDMDVDMTLYSQVVRFDAVAIDAQNKPGGDYATKAGTAVTQANANTAYGWQLFITDDVDHPLCCRVLINGTWQAWRKLSTEVIT